MALVDRNKEQSHVERKGQRRTTREGKGYQHKGMERTGEEGIEPWREEDKGRKKGRSRTR